MRFGIGVLLLGNFTSKIVGALREVLFAAWFGTGETATAFRIAQTAYLLPTQALIGDALSAGLLPQYKLEQRDAPDQARVLVVVASLYGLLFSAVVTPLLFLWSASVAAFVAPGASASALALAADLLRIMALATPFYILSGILSYVETAFGRYGAIAWRPMLLNCGSIAGAALAVWLGQDHWLAAGILASHIVFFLWTIMQMRKLDRLWPEQKLARSLVSSIASKFLRTMLPLLGLPLVAQMMVLAERIVSSWLGTEVIPSVDYARFVCDTMVQLIAVPLGIMTMSVHGGSSAQVMRRHVSEITGSVMMVAFPAGLFIAMNAETVVRLLFARGAFDAQSVATTSTVMLWMAGALGLTVTAYYLVKVLNAQLRNREALVFTLCASGVSVLVNVSLWERLGPQVVGVAVASYAGTLCILSFRALGLWSSLGRMMPWLTLGLFAQFATGELVETVFGKTLLVFPVQILAIIALWLVLVAFIGPLNRAALPVLSRVAGLKRLAR